MPGIPLGVHRMGKYLCPLHKRQTINEYEQKDVYSDECNGAVKQRTDQGPEGGR